MRLRLILGLTPAFLLGFGLSSAHAGPTTGFAGSSNQDAFTLTFDEFSNGLISNPTGSTPVPITGTVIPDPTAPAGSSATVLAFPLPMPVITGDVRIWETTLGSGPLSDVLRFTNAAGNVNGALVGNLMLFYSDAAEPDAPGAPADTFGIPTTLFPRDGGGILQTPVGNEAANGFTWTPNGPNDNIYVGFSDGTIPEPSSIILFGLGILGPLGYAWHRRRRTAA